jgi:hypothetical protein
MMTATKAAATKVPTHIYTAVLLSSDCGRCKKKYMYEYYS